jgi:hypothetical protein
MTLSNAFVGEDFRQLLDAGQKSNHEPSGRRARREESPTESSHPQTQPDDIEKMRQMVGEMTPSKRHAAAIEAEEELRGGRRINEAEDRAYVTVRDRRDANRRGYVRVPVEPGSKADNAEQQRKQRQYDPLLA